MTPLLPDAMSGFIRLQISLHDGSKKTFELGNEHLLIGRHHDCDLVLEDDSVSRCHAELRRRGALVVLKDRGSLNGLRVNGQQRDEEELAIGDVVHIGDVPITIDRVEWIDDSKPAAAEFVLHADGTTGVMEVIRAIRVTDYGVDATNGHATLFGGAEANSDGQQKLQQAYANMLSIMEFVSRVGSYSHPKQIGQQFVTALKKVFPLIDGAAVISVNESNEREHHVLYQEGVSTEQSPNSPSRTVLRRVVDELRALYAVDASRDPRFQRSDSVKSREVRSMMAAPLVIRGKAIGAIYVENIHQPYCFGPFDLNLLTLFAFHLANALETARLLQERDHAFQEAASTLSESRKSKAATLLQFAQSEKKFRALFEQSAIGAAVVSLEGGRISDVNDGLIRMLGYSRAQFLTMSLTQLRHLRSEDQAEEDAWLDQVRRNGEGVRKTILRTASGDPLVALQSCRTLGLNSDSMMVANFIDITAQERAEQELRVQLGRVTLLSSFAESVMSMKTEDAIAALLYRKLRDVVELSALWIAVIDETNSTVSVRHHFGDDPDAIVDRTVEGIATIRKLRNGESFITAGRRRFGPRIYLPIALDGEGISFVCAQSGPGKAIHQSQLDTARALAAQASLALTNARSFEEIRSQRESLRQLSLQTMTAQEAERARISRELHDGVGQQLTAMKYVLESLRNAAKSGDQERIIERINEASDLATQTIEDLRSISLDLRPTMLDDLGLEPTLVWFCRRFTEQTGIEAQLLYHSSDFTLPIITATNIYRVVQEALSNAAKHSKADRITIEVETRDDFLRVLVLDNGQGFDPSFLRAAQGERGCSGIVNMRERTHALGGDFRIESAVGEGTRLSLTVPLREYTP